MSGQILLYVKRLQTTRISWNKLFQKKKYLLWIFAALPFLRFQKSSGRLKRWIYLKMEETGNVAFVKSRAYSVAFRISFRKCSRHFSCCSLQLWGKKKKEDNFFSSFKKKSKIHTITDIHTSWWDKIKLWGLAMLILVSFLSSQDAILLLPKKLAATLTQWTRSARSLKHVRIFSSLCPFSLQMQG